MQRAGAASVPSATTSQWIRYRLKLRRRQLTEDVNVEISGRDLGRVPDEGAADRPGASQFDPLRSLAGVGRDGKECPIPDLRHPRAQID